MNAFGYNYDTGSFDTRDIIDRYGMSFVGGLAGGSLTSLGTNFKMDIKPIQREEAL
jgi:hypothetical protein